MKGIVIKLAAALRLSLAALPVPAEGKRVDRLKLYAALESVRSILIKEWGGPTRVRYSGCLMKSQPSYAKEGKTFKVMEYLWDFSVSRHSIPETIEQNGAKSLVGGKFELLFLAESELGTKDEICRDLLKVMEGRAKVRALVYKQPAKPKVHMEFRKRMIRVMENHAHFRTAPIGEWLFVGLKWNAPRVTCEIYTLNDGLTEMVPIP